MGPQQRHGLFPFHPLLKVYPELATGLAVYPSRPAPSPRRNPCRSPHAGKGGTGAGGIDWRPFPLHNGRVTLDEITNFCEFKECTVSLGDPEAGFIRVDGNGVQTRFNNYRRFLAHHELAALPSPKQVLEKATVFRIEENGQTRTLSREEFQAELQAFQEKVGMAG